MFRKPITKKPTNSNREIFIFSPFDFAIYGLASFDLPLLCEENVKMLARAEHFLKMG